MKTLIALLLFTITAHGQAAFRAMTNLPVRLHTLGVSNFTSVGTFKADSDTGLWFAMWATNQGSTGTVWTAWQQSFDGTNYETQPIQLAIFINGSNYVQIIRTNLPSALSQVARNFKLISMTNTLDCNVTVSNIWYSRKY